MAVWVFTAPIFISVRKRRQANQTGGHKTKPKTKHTQQGLSSTFAHEKQSTAFAGKTGRQLCVKCVRCQESPKTSAGSRPVWPQIYRRVCGLLCFCGPTGMRNPGVATVSVCTHAVCTAYVYIERTGWIIVRESYRAC